MREKVQFDKSKPYRMILRDSTGENTYYGLDDFDCKYLKIIQAKFGCNNSFHTIPDRVKMEMVPFEWSEIRQKYVLRDSHRTEVQLNRLESVVVTYTKADF